MTANERITLSQLEEMFSQIRNESPWDPDADLTWGYYFVDPDIEKLEQAGYALEEQGYTLVGILEPDTSDDSIADTPERDMFFLHVARVETHSPETLHSRNQELYDFAAQQDLFGYDGMDVGPAGELQDEELEIEFGIEEEEEE